MRKASGIPRLQIDHPGSARHIKPRIAYPKSRLRTLLHWVSGTAEILGGLGLILPGVTRIQTRLVPLAAIGLLLVMLGAMVYHITRGEYANLGTNLILAALLAFIAYGRYRLKPLSDRSASPATS